MTNLNTEYIFLTLETFYRILLIQRLACMNIRLSLVRSQPFRQHYRSEHEQYSMSSMCFTHNLCICVSCPVSLLPQQRPVNSNVREKEDVLQKRCGIEGAFGTFFSNGFVNCILTDFKEFHVFNLLVCLFANLYFEENSNIIVQTNSYIVTQQFHSLTMIFSEE